MFFINVKTYVYDRTNSLDFCVKAIKFLFIQHIACVFKINPYFMQSSDYIDYLDFGEIPPEGSENWVAPFVIDILNTEFKTEFIEVYNVLKESTKMQI